MLRHEVAVLRRQVAGLGRPGGPGSAGPAATSRATCPPARQTGHTAGLAPPSDHAQADVPEPARPTAHQPGDPRPHTAAGAASTASRTRSCRNPRRSPCSVRSPAAIASRTSPPDPAAGGRAARPAHPGKSCARAPRPSPRRPGRARSAAPTGQLPSRRAGGASCAPTASLAMLPSTVTRCSARSPRSNSVSSNADRPLGRVPAAAPHPARRRACPRRPARPRPRPAGLAGSRTPPPPPADRPPHAPGSSAPRGAAPAAS